MATDLFVKNEFKLPCFYYFLIFNHYIVEEIILNKMCGLVVMVFDVILGSTRRVDLSAETVYFHCIHTRFTPTENVYS